VRICIVSLASRVHGIGGLQDHTTDLARALYREGHDVEVITAAHPTGTLREEDWEGIRWRYADAPPTWFGDRRWLVASHAAYREASAVRPFDVVHGQGSGGLGLVLRGVHRETPFVEMFHGNYIGLVKAAGRRLRASGSREHLRELRGLAVLTRRHFAHGNAHVFRDCEAIVPSEQQLRDTCRSHRLDAEHVHVVPNGVDTAVFAPRPRAAVRALLGMDDAFRFVCVGRLNREKGMHHAISALAALRGMGVAARLVIVGDGEERADLERHASRLGVAEIVDFVGACRRPAVAAYLAASDVFVFPTERDEAAPLVLPQALAVGTPVIASRCGGIPEVIDRPGRNGILVGPADQDALVRAMLELHRNADLRRTLSVNGLVRVAERYSLERMVAGTLAVYDAAHTPVRAAGRLSLRARRAGLLAPPLVLHRAAAHAVGAIPLVHHLHL
jgi:glycosyltransferase involved in cell wall biosynthesis